MKSTRFLRMFTNFLNYKTYSLLPSLIITILVAFTLINFVLIILYEKENIEKRFKAIDEFFICACLFACVAKRSLSPEDVNKILDLIEGELLEDNKNHSHMSHKWEKIHLNYSKRKESMEKLYKKMSILSIGMLFGYISRNIIGGTIGSEENFKDWPTPYVYWCPTGYDSLSVFMFVEILQIVMLTFFVAEGFSLLLTICLATERVLADFVTIYKLLENLIEDFTEPENDFKLMQTNQDEVSSRHVNLRRDMIVLVQCHQSLNSNFKQCADYSAYGIVLCTSIIYADTVACTYIMLKAYNVKRLLYFAATTSFVNLVILFCYHNGQKIVNQNDHLRKYLAEVPWVDKPQWFKTSLCIMMRRANIDTQLKPYNVFVMNHESYKDILKAAFSFGNIIYSLKSNSM